MNIERFLDKRPIKKERISAEQYVELLNSSLQPEIDSVKFEPSKNFTSKKFGSFIVTYKNPVVRAY